MFENEQNQTTPGSAVMSTGAQQPNQTVPQPTVMPAPAAAEPRDMFADVDQAPPTVMPQQPSGETPAEGGAGYTFEEDEEPKPWYMQKKFIVLLLGIVLLLIIVIFGVQFALRLFAPAAAPVVPIPTSSLTPSDAVVPQAAQQPTSTTTETEQAAPTPNEETSQSSEAPQQTPPQEGDTDGDGLLDSEEQAIGTDLTNKDTDGDGLTDREEFRVFGTDPLKPDTDGDTYLDGVEVKSGYNPKGEGKLFTIPTEE